MTDTETRESRQKAIDKLNEKAAPDLQASERELTREQRISKAHNHALGVVKDAHIKEFNEAKVAEAKRLGVTWAPKLTKEEQAQKDLEALLAENPSLEAALMRRIHDEMRAASELSTDGVPEPSTPVGMEARAVVTGHVRAGILSEDGETFTFKVSGEDQATKQFRLVADNTPLGPA